MKKIFSIFIIFSCVFGLAQQKQFEIGWKQSRILSTETTSLEIPSFNQDHFSFNEVSGIRYYAQWSETSLVNEQSAKLSNISSITISEADLKDVPRATIPSTPLLVLKNVSERGKIFIHVEISPIIRQNGVYKKITGFTINYKYGAQQRSLDVVRSRRDVTNSVLSSGSWHRFYVDKSGVFRLTKGFLEQIGVNTDVDPRTIKIFGNGGAMLPLKNEPFYPIDLTENAIKFVGEQDGVFNNGDFILFYAEGPREYSEESDTNINLYTDRSHYFVNVSGGSGKRIAEMPQSNGAANLQIDTFRDYQFYEVDETNIARLGRRWFGDRFDVENVREYSFSFPNLVTTVPARIRILTGALNEGNTTAVMTAALNGEVLGDMEFDPPPANTNFIGDFDAIETSVNLNSPELNFRLTFDNGGNPSVDGYLDFISVEATRRLRFEGRQFRFQNDEVINSSGIAQYTLSNATSVQEIWDISDKYNVTSAANTEASDTFSFKASAGSEKTYITVTNSNYFEPLRDRNTLVANQNLKGTVFKNPEGEFEDIDYIIIAPRVFFSQAERLAQINRDNNLLNVKVVVLDDIYTEFSSGNQDVSAIRNFVKYVYDNASAPEERLKYLCLFGDASFDYKNRIPNNTNFVPSWHSLNSFSLTSSFVSDDFFGMMDANEGTLATTDRLDIAVGRILADSPQRAKQMVDKIELHYGQESLGTWRNNYLVVSDDVDKNGEGELQQVTDAIGDEVSEEKGFINTVKIHSDSYQQQATSSGARYPEANQDFRDAIEVGALAVSYFGHGGENGLSGERIFTKVDAQEINNLCKFNVFITITCEYTRFDNPLRETAGELTYWNTDGGAIGLITTTRRVFLSTGTRFNKTLGQYLFAYNDVDRSTMAEALRRTKNDPNVVGNRQKYLMSFIGDPAMPFAMARPDIRLMAINDVPIGQSPDVLEALGRVKMSGEVYDSQGNFLSNYNGILTATVFDKQIERQTLANDGVVDPKGGIDEIMDFNVLGETIFKGQATVTNGRFDFNFVVPRDIGVPIGNGRVSFYAKQDGLRDDKAGSSIDFQVGGINENAAEDNIGPVINLFMNDENFVSGGITNEAPTLLAKLQDENGINTASGIGHDIVALIDGDETNPFILNDYYQAEVDDYQNGKVSYPFRDLEPGLHTLTLKAWDVYNNASTAEIEFIVRDEDEELVIENVLNYPNPFIDYTEFWFNHNSSGVLDISVQIFTVSGKVIRTLNGQTAGGGKNISSLSKDIVWDGRDDFGDKIGKGVYIYKLKVRSNALNKQVEKIEKLVIL